MQRTEKIAASHDFLDEKVKTLFIGGTKESMDYESKALPNFQVNVVSIFPLTNKRNNLIKDNKN